MGFMERLEAIPTLYRWLIMPAVLLVLAALYWNLVYQPYAEELATVEQQIQTKESELHKHRQIAAQYDRFKAEVAVLEDQLGKLRKFLPESKEIPDLIRQISDLGVRTGLQISLLRPQPEQRRQYYAEVPITVRVKGQYHAIGRFFDELGRLPRIVSVDGLQIDASSQETQCLATTFRYLEDDEVQESAATSKKKAGKKEAEADEDSGVGKKGGKS